MATVQPIKSTDDLDTVRDTLTNNRDRALFELGVGTAFRGSDLLALKIKDVRGLEAGDDLVIREQKTKHNNKAARRVTLNSITAAAVASQVADRVLDGAADDDWVFVSQSRFKSSKAAALTGVSLTRLWKQWTAAAGLKGHFGAHSGRKSVGYLSRVEDGVGIEVLQKMYGHSSPKVTQAYICVLDEEVQAVFMKNRTNR